MDVLFLTLTLLSLRTTCFSWNNSAKMKAEVERVDCLVF